MQKIILFLCVVFSLNAFSQEDSCSNPVYDGDIKNLAVFKVENITGSPDKKISIYPSLQLKGMPLVSGAVSYDKTLSFFTPLFFQAENEKQVAWIYRPLSGLSEAVLILRYRQDPCPLSVHIPFSSNALFQ